MRHYIEAIRNAQLVRRLGTVRQVAGLSVESSGPRALLGEICEIVPRAAGHPVRAEVVGLRGEHVVLMPFGQLHGIGVGCEVRATGQVADLAVSTSLLGRVIDVFGEPLDGGPPLPAGERRPLKAGAPAAMSRPPVTDIMETGVRSLDAMLTLGRGQRVGIFAGSGVGKSTLLGMIARHALADVNVIALIGERGREVREFIDKQLGVKGMARSVVVVATSDQPALARTRAAYAATTIAEYFRELGQQVMLTMDSVTRFAMARREIGLAAGEPPTARGYTPSVFAELPQLCERCGTAAGGGSITALYTVLVEGDDFNEPVSDMLRATLDGHVVLSRSLAQQAHFPAIDVLQSASRLLPDLVPGSERDLVYKAMGRLATYERNRPLIEMGAYRQGAQAEIDDAIACWPRLRDFLRQASGKSEPRTQAMAVLAASLGQHAVEPT